MRTTISNKEEELLAQIVSKFCPDNGNIFYIKVIVEYIQAQLEKMGYENNYSCHPDETGVIMLTGFFDFNNDVLFPNNRRGTGYVRGDGIYFNPVIKELSYCKTESV